jgi:isoquinoline 1-oxidoreductase subunit beta
MSGGTTSDAAGPCDAPAPGHGHAENQREIARGRGIALMYSNWDTYVAQVAVSRRGEIRVHRLVCSVDCGIVVNPDTVKAQIEGGAIFGISGALHGEVTLENGRVQQSNFSDVLVLRIGAADGRIAGDRGAPRAQPRAPRRDRRAPGAAVTAPALANAVFAATGKRIRKLPLERHLRSA